MYMWRRAQIIPYSLVYKYFCHAFTILRAMIFVHLSWVFPLAVCLSLMCWYASQFWVYIWISFLLLQILLLTLADLEASEMALAIFPVSSANPSCIAARELSKVLHEEAPILASHFPQQWTSMPSGTFFLRAMAAFLFLSSAVVRNSNVL